MKIMLKQQILLLIITESIGSTNTNDVHTITHQSQVSTSLISVSLLVSFISTLSSSMAGPTVMKTPPCFKVLTM